jgi:hypothetical protein
MDRKRGESDQRARKAWVPVVHCCADAKIEVCKDVRSMAVKEADTHFGHGRVTIGTV